MIKRVSVILLKPSVHKMGLVLGLQSVGMLLPLVSFPYLSRTLGPGPYGAMMFAAAFGGYLELVIAFGFDVSATGDVAQAGEDRQARGRILAGVLSAQILLALAVTVPALVAGCFMPIFHQWPSLLPLGIVAGLVQGFTLTWYFQGINRLPFASLVTLLAQAVYVALVIAVVHHPADAPWCLVCYIVPNLVGIGVLWRVARKTVQCPKMNLKIAREAISSGLGFLRLPACRRPRGPWAEGMVSLPFSASRAFSAKLPFKSTSC